MNLLAAALALLNTSNGGVQRAGSVIRVPAKNEAEIRRLSRKAFDTEAERRFAWEQSGKRCEWWLTRTQRCEATFPEPRHCQLDHFIPRQPRFGRKGATDLSNVAALCPSCNGRKSNRQPPRWMRDKIITERAKQRDRV